MNPVAAYDQIAVTQEMIARATWDFRYFCKTFVRIITRDGVQPLIFNTIQERLWKEVQAQMQAGKPVRIIILKARQMGCSTWVQAFLFWRAMTKPATGGMVIAHDEDSTGELFDKIFFMYEELEQVCPEWFHQLEAIRDTKKKGRKIAWRGQGQFALNTSITVQTAGNKKAGRSRTLKRIHMSEVAFWDEPEKLVFGLTQAVGQGSDTDIFKESTANGIGNWFHRDWKRAKDGRSQYAPVFGAWHEEKSYTTVPDEGFTLTYKERALQRKYNLTRGQLAWRRTTIDDEMEGDEDLFRQEYPSNDKEAFLVTGRPYFGRKHVEYYMGQTETPMREGRLNFTEGGTPTFSDEEDGPWRIFRKPVRGHPYVVSGDVAGGTGADFSFAVVLDLITLETVATYMDKIDPDEFAYELRVMAKTYHKDHPALVIPEKNGEGRATVLKLVKSMNCRVFYHTEEEDWDGGVVTSYGWRTSTKTRPVMLAQTAALLRKRELKVLDERIVEQLGSFVRVDGAKIAEAQPGTNDDGVMALCIAASDEVRQQGAYIDYDG